MAARRIVTIPSGLFAGCVLKIIVLQEQLYDNLTATPPHLSLQRWVPACIDQCQPLDESESVIQAKQRDSSSAYRSPTDDARTLKKEMLLPDLFPWVEDRRRRSIFWVEARKVGAFPPIAFHTCKS